MELHTKTPTSPPIIPPSEGSLTVHSEGAPCKQVLVNAFHTLGNSGWPLYRKEAILRRLNIAHQFADELVIPATLLPTNPTTTELRQDKEEGSLGAHLDTRGVRIIVSTVAASAEAILAKLRQHKSHSLKGRPEDELLNNAKWIDNETKASPNAIQVDQRDVDNAMTDLGETAQEFLADSLQADLFRSIKTALDKAKSNNNGVLNGTSWRLQSKAFPNCGDIFAAIARNQYYLAYSLVTGIPFLYGSTLLVPPGYESPNIQVGPFQEILGLDECVQHMIREHGFQVGYPSNNGNRVSINEHQRATCLPLVSDDRLLPAFQPHCVNGSQDVNGKRPQSRTQVRAGRAATGRLPKTHFVDSVKNGKYVPIVPCRKDTLTSRIHDHKQWDVVIDDELRCLHLTSKLKSGQYQTREVDLNEKGHKRLAEPTARLIFTTIWTAAKTASKTGERRVFLSYGKLEEHCGKGNAQQAMSEFRTALGKEFVKKFIKNSPPDKGYWIDFSEINITWFSRSRDIANSELRKRQRVSPTPLTE